MIINTIQNMKEKPNNIAKEKNKYFIIFFFFSLSSFMIFFSPFFSFSLFLFIFVLLLLNFNVYERSHIYSIKNGAKKATV